MGLFSSRPKWRKLAQKAEKSESRGLWADALAYYEDAHRVAPETEHAQLAERIEASRNALFTMHWQAASELVENQDLTSAEDRFVLAERFATQPEQREQTANAIRDLVKKRVALEQAAEWDEEDEDEAVESDAPRLSTEDAFLIVAGAHTEYIADRYQERDDGFREAVLQRVEGNPETALAVFEPMVDSGGDAIDAFEYALCLRALDRTEEALPHLKSVVAAEPDWLEAGLELTRAAWYLEEWEVAEETLQDAMDRSEETVDPRLYGAVAQTALLTKQPDYGIEAADELLGKNPNDRGVQVLKGQLLELQGKADKALALYESVIQSTWQYDHEEGKVLFDVSAGILAVRIYLARGEKLDRAEELVRAALVVTPPSARWAYQLMLGEVLLAAGKGEEGEQTVTEAARLIPEDNRVARMRAAELLGKDAEVERLAETLTDAERVRWEERVPVASRNE